MIRLTIFLLSTLVFAPDTMAQTVTNSRADALIVAVKPAPPFVIKNPDGSFSGISIALWENIANELQLDFRYRETDLKTLLDGVAQGRFGAGVGAITVTAERETRMDFSQPFFTSGLGIAVASSESPGWWLVARRFLSAEFLTAALALIAILLLAGLLVWFFERHQNEEQFGGKTGQGIAAGFWWAAVTMTTVGYGDKSPQTLGGRLVGVVWMFTAIIIISSFTASIASSLTAGKLTARINGPEDLANARVASLPDSTSAAYLQGNSVGFNAFDGLPAALDALAAGNVDAVVYDAPLLHYYIQQRDDDGLMVLPGMFERQDYAFALPEDSPLQEAVNRQLLVLTSEPAWENMLSRYLGNTFE